MTVNSISAEDPILESLPIQNLVALVKGMGWKKVDHPNERVLLFDGPLDDEGRPIQLVIPRDHNLADANRRLADALNLITAVSGEPIHYLLKSIEDFEQDSDESFVAPASLDQPTSGSPRLGVKRKSGFLASEFTLADLSERLVRKQALSLTTLWQRILPNLVLLLCAFVLGIGLISYNSYRSDQLNRRLFAEQLERERAKKLAELLSTTDVFQSTISDILAEVNFEPSNAERTVVRISPDANVSELHEKSKRAKEMENQLQEMISRDRIWIGEDAYSKLRTYVNETPGYYADFRRGAATKDQTEQRSRIWDELKDKFKAES